MMRFHYAFSSNVRPALRKTEVICRMWSSAARLSSRSAGF
jgi:hypothetical protein